MSITYKRIINEYTIMFKYLQNNCNNNETISYKYNLINIHNLKYCNLIKNHLKDFNYKIFIAQHPNLLYKTVINFSYKGEFYIIKIDYNKYYPLEPPQKILINDVNIYTVYNNIIKRCHNLLYNYTNICDINSINILNKSLLHSSNWRISCNIKELLVEILKVIDYKNLYIEIRLLNSVINKYCPNDDLGFLYYYLL